VPTLSRRLEKAVSLDVIHGNSRKGARVALSKHSATAASACDRDDVAAARIDVDGVFHVINYDLQQSPRATLTASVVPAARRDWHRVSRFVT